MDVQVKTRKIEDPTEEEGKYNSRNHVYAAHILCAKKDEKEVDIQMGNLYNKVRKSFRAAADLPEERAMRYVPYEGTHKIAQTPKCRVSQSAYCSELAGVIASLTVLNVLVRHHNITNQAVTITLDEKLAMDKSSSDWPLSIDQKCFYHLQIIRAWIKLSPLTFTFRHVKGHQIDKVAYNHLDWWGNATKM